MNKSDENARLIQEIEREKAKELRRIARRETLKDWGTGLVAALAVLLGVVITLAIAAALLFFSLGCALWAWYFMANQLANHL